MIKNLLLDYQSHCTEEERNAVAIMLHFFETIPDCFERSHLLRHFTGSCWILNEKRDKCLLTHHRKLNQWMQLGGHADGDKDIFEVAAKEAIEESGLEVFPISKVIFDVDIHEIPIYRDVPAHLHYDVRFLFKASDQVPFKVSDESHDLAWVPLKEINKFTTERSVLRMQEKSLSVVSL